MAIEKLEQIKDAENEAARILKTAAEEAETIINNAGSECKKLIEKTYAHNAAENVLINNKADKDIDAAVEAVRNASEKEASALRKAAAAKMSAATSLVLERVVG